MVNLKFEKASKADLPFVIATEGGTRHLGDS
jgi:hypothetical protein